MERAPRLGFQRFRVLGFPHRLRRATRSIHALCAPDSNQVHEAEEESSRFWVSRLKV
jgi:hypothetical protein